MRDDFEVRLRGSLDDQNIEDGLSEFQRSWARSRGNAVAELESLTGQTFDELRSRFSMRKRAVRDEWDLNLARFEERAVAAGTVVLHAADAGEAVAAILQICRAEGVALVVKTKSMATEEIGLNDYLEQSGIRAVESDLGEWLLQISSDHPSHLVLPIIHRRRHQIAALLQATLGRQFDPDDIGTMVRCAREQLRPILTTAGAGITGGNAAIVSTGAVMIVSNEGNAGLTLSVPPVHIAVVGIEKLVGSTHDALDQVRLLARSATGQPITTYTTFVAGPRAGQRQYIVLLDNGRRAMNADPVAESALSCIRCGACADVCPPYGVVGGHAFGYVYTGAIGLVTTPFHHGLDKIANAQSLCVSCGACTSVCPANIPLAEQILHVRARTVEELPNLATRVTTVALRAFARPRLFRISTRLAGFALTPVSSGRSVRVSRPARHLGWRRAPAMGGRPARARIQRIEPTSFQGGRDALLFLQCISDAVEPAIGTASFKLLNALGLDVGVPPQQHCCGLPALDSGDRVLARKMAEQTINALDGSQPVVTPAPSCAIAIRCDYQSLFADDPPLLRRAEQLAARTVDLMSFLQGRMGTLTAVGSPTGLVASHTFCQSTNVLTLGQLQNQTLERAGAMLCTVADPTSCCGFGGISSVVQPEVARRLLDRKLDTIVESGADVLVTDNPGCMLHLRGGAAARGLPLQVVHIAEYLDERFQP